MVIIDLSANETKARAYSQQGHGKQHKPIQRPDTYQRLPEDMQLNTCEQQPVHTFRAPVVCLMSHPSVFTDETTAFSYQVALLEPISVDVTYFKIFSPIQTRTRFRNS
ncbi:hypothetical protein SuNHUV7_21500 (plasmid) [Pseudoseohaeicola sp. NH-UV-7]